jgi:drug/metabolite transporter (DMT)-like permease
MSGPAAAPRRKATAIAALLVVCVIWGSTFLLMEVGTDAVRGCYGDDPLWNGALFLGVRFLIAAAAMPILVPGCVAALDRAAWKHGFWLSLVFSAAFLLQIFGLAQQDVPPSQSAFLTSLYVVATPLIGAAVYRRAPTKGALLGVPVSLAGAACIAGLPSAGFSAGAWATLACAVLFGGQILMTDHSTRRVDPRALTLTMLVLSAGWMGLGVAAAPGGWGRAFGKGGACLLRSPAFVSTELVCALIATVLVVSLFNRWQKELSPTRAAIVYTTEPIFAAIFSILAGRDRLTGLLVLGGSLILGANVIAELVGRRPEPAAQKV